MLYKWIYILLYKKKRGPLRNFTGLKDQFGRIKITSKHDTKKMKAVILEVRSQEGKLSRPRQR